MDISLIWKTILIFAYGTLIIRIGGRKSLTQMTIPETVIIVSIGALIVEPIASRGMIETFVVTGVFVLCLIIAEFIQLKSDRSETVITGKAVPIIENGVLIENNLKKLRLTVDKLEDRLRQTGIVAISDVQYATIETSGELGYTLKHEKQPATKEDIQNLINLIKNGSLINQNQNSQPIQPDNIFVETLHPSEKKEIPKHLQ
jgi:uncharacterized membrane protein YcaP (DUF421 family)